MKLTYELAIDVDVYEQFKEQVMTTWFECDKPLLIGHAQLGTTKYASFITDNSADRKTFEKIVRKMPYDSVDYRLVITRNLWVLAYETDVYYIGSESDCEECYNGFYDVPEIQEELYIVPFEEFVENFMAVV